MLSDESAAVLPETGKSEDRLCSVASRPLSIADARTLVEKLAQSEPWKNIAGLEQGMEAHPASFREIPTEHTFTPGLYQRHVFMKAGDLLVTRIHLTEHPFLVLVGRFLVWTEEDGVVEISAPFRGITKPGTRRVIYVIEGTIFTTTHANPTNESDPEKIMAEITYNNRELREKVA